jgi:hypothetical protein
MLGDDKKADTNFGPQSMEMPGMLGDTTRTQRWNREGEGI